METDALTKRKVMFFSRKSTGDIIFDIFNLLTILLFCFAILYPFWSTFLLSFSESADTQSIGFHFWIKSWNTLSYRFVFSKTNIYMAYFNSIFRAVIGTTLTIIFTILAAYPLSDRTLPGRNIITIYFLITMFFSGGLIPTYLLIRKIGLMNSRWVLILPVMAIAYYIIIMRNFLMTIDKAYEESAFIDGANYFQILVRIIIPISKPVIATIALWASVYHWNAWFDALIYIRDDSKIVLQLLLRKIVIEAEQAFDDAMRNFESEVGLDELPTAAVKSAVTFLTIGPIVLAYPFLQKYFVKGIFIGSLKG
jgi:putative aldouronate transport system permease protein